MKVAAAQLAPVFLDRKATLEKAIAAQAEAAAAGAELLVFPETFVPGYPSWADYTHASYFDHPDQKAAWARYLTEAVDLDVGDLDEFVASTREAGVFTYLGVAERSTSTASIYCSLIAIDPEHGIVGVHRKLKPTFGERLMWADGDAAGLLVHEWRGWRVSGLNCWENWMPLARTAMYAQGTQLHVAGWPGSAAISHDISRFIALEGRVFVISAGGILREEHLPADFVLGDEMRTEASSYASGGSIIVAPDGTTLAEAKCGEECLIYADVDLNMVQQERQNFDPTGHYSRPDLLQLSVDRRRSDSATFRDG